MNKLNLFLACLLLLAPTFLFSFSDSLVVYFQTDEFVLNSEQQSTLSDYCDQIDFSVDFKLLVKGFADHRGTNDYNKVLAENRAKTVRDYLLQNDLLEREVELLSLGEEQSFIKGKDDEILAPDRKVVVYYQTRKYESLDEFMDELVDNDHSYKLSPKQENRIDLPGGSRLILQESCLTDKEGNLVEEEIELKVSEAVSYIQMLSENLSTESDGEMLETGGMFKIEAFDKNGNELLLDKEKPMQLIIPTEEVKPDMQLFTSDQGNDWVPVGQMTTVLFDDTQYAPIPPQPKSFPLPQFERKEYQIDDSDKPYRPAYLAEPEAPIEPLPGDFKYRVEWYRYPWRRKHEKRMERAYEKAMEYYDRAYSKYEKKVAYYEENNRTYSKRLNEYEGKFAKWEEREELNAREFYEQQEDELNGKYEKFREMVKKLSGAVYALAMEKYEQELAEYREWKEKELDNLDLNNVNSLREISAYAFSLTNFGWVNCDRFPEDNSQRGEILVDSTESESNDERIVAIFEDIQSMMNFYSASNEQYVLSGIPLNRTATVLAFKVENGQVFMAKQKAMPGDELTLDYRVSNYREVASVLADREI